MKKDLKGSAKFTAEPQHTPTPLFVNGPFDNENDLFLRTTIDGENFDIANFSCDETGKAKEWARLIVKAANSHYELLEALKSSIDLLTELKHLKELKEDVRQDLVNQIQAGIEAIQKATP